MKAALRDFPLEVEYILMAFNNSYRTVEELFGGLASAGPFHAFIIGWQKEEEESALSATEGEKNAQPLLQ